MKDLLILKKQDQLSVEDVLTNGVFLNLKEVLETLHPDAVHSVSLAEKFRLGINQGVAVSCQPEAQGFYGAPIKNGWLMQDKYFGRKAVWLVYVAKYFKGQNQVVEALPLGQGLIPDDTKFALA